MIKEEEVEDGMISSPLQRLKRPHLEPEEAEQDRMTDTATDGTHHRDDRVEEAEKDLVVEVVEDGAEDEVKTTVETAIRRRMLPIAKST